MIAWAQINQQLNGKIFYGPREVSFYHCLWPRLKTTSVTIPNACQLTLWQSTTSSNGALCQRWKIQLTGSYPKTFRERNFSEWESVANKTFLQQKYSRNFFNRIPQIFLQQSGLEPAVNITERIHRQRRLPLDWFSILRYTGCYTIHYVLHYLCGNLLVPRVGI